MARTYKRDERGRFAGGGGSSKKGGQKASSKPANKVVASPRRLTSDEKKVAKVMGDKSLRSDRQKMAALASAGFKGDAVAAFANVRKKLGVNVGGSRVKGMTSPAELRKAQDAAVKKFNASVKPTTKKQTSKPKKKAKATKAATKSRR